MRGNPGWRVGRRRSAASAGLVLAALLHSGLSPASIARAQAFLGTAQSFGVLGGSTVTNTGPSVITGGNLGVWSGLAITGFPPGVVVPPGAIHAGDAVAQQAQSDVTTAYNSLAGMACNTDLTGQDLGGLTLTPGVYCFASSAQLTGNLTLDAQGNNQAVFVFQIGSSLTTATNASVSVINGGQDCNVSWQVGSSATLGTATSFVGNIVALTSITLNTTANLSGRALARNGAVTLDNNAITVPLCALPPTATFTASPGPSPTATRTSTPGPSPPATNPSTPSPTHTSTRTSTPSPTRTSTRTSTPGPSPTATNTLPPGALPSPTPVTVGGFTAGSFRPAKVRGRVTLPNFVPLRIGAVLGFLAVLVAAAVWRRTR